MLEINKVHHGRCMDLFKELGNESIDIFELNGTSQPKTEKQQAELFKDLKFAPKPPNGVMDGLSGSKWYFDE